MRINWQDKEALALLVEAGYASTEKRMMTFCTNIGIRPSKLVDEIGRDVVEYYAKLWSRKITGGDLNVGN